jgi:hypothetical protein
VKGQCSPASKHFVIGMCGDRQDRSRRITIHGTTLFLPKFVDLISCL